VHLGFARSIAEELAIQTVLGTAAMARESGQHLAMLRNAVTSPGGTTAAGIYELEAGALRAVVDRAVKVAYDRCVELGK
jgi:pyrroline-5-carboxylate reductase